MQEFCVYLRLIWNSCVRWTLWGTFVRAVPYIHEWTVPRCSLSHWRNFFVCFVLYSSLYVLFLWNENLFLLLCCCYVFVCRQLTVFWVSVEMCVWKIWHSTAHICIICRWKTHEHYIVTAYVFFFGIYAAEDKSLSCKASRRLKSRGIYDYQCSRWLARQRGSLSLTHTSFILLVLFWYSQ